MNIKNRESLRPLEFICISFVCALVPSFGAGLAHAESFAIVLDNNCLAYHKNNLTSNCPTYEEINLLFPNDPCPYIAERCLRYYEFDSAHRYFIDPTAEILDRIKTITLRANFKEFKLPQQQGFNNTSHSIQLGVGRYIDDSCHNAYIDANRWVALTGDTIYHMLKDCTPSSTNYDESRQITFDKVSMISPHHTSINWKNGGRK